MIKIIKKGERISEEDIQFFANGKPINDFVEAGEDIKLKKIGKDTVQISFCSPVSDKDAYLTGAIYIKELGIEGEAIITNYPSIIFIGNYKGMSEENQYYLQNSVVKGTKMNLGDYNKFKGWVIPADEDPLKEGYLVNSSDGSTTWTPKEKFEKMSIPLGEEAKVTDELVDSFWKSSECTKMGEKTTVLMTELINGFVIVESSSCVDPRDYDQFVGIKICQKRTRERVWEYLGFLLQQGLKESKV